MLLAFLSARVGICDTQILLMVLSREPHLQSLKYIHRGDTFRLSSNKRFWLSEVLEWEYATP